MKGADQTSSVVTGSCVPPVNGNGGANITGKTVYVEVSFESVNSAVRSTQDSPGHKSITPGLVVATSISTLAQSAGGSAIKKVCGPVQILLSLSEHILRT